MMAQERLQLTSLKRMWRFGRRKTPIGRSSGQALVEFALIAPLFLLLLFGVVEYSLINASIGTFNFAAKEAARTDAIIGNGASPITTLTLDEYIVNDVIVPRVNGIVIAQMQEVVVYKADQTGACFGGGTPPGCGTQDVLQYVGGTWTSTSNNWLKRNDALSNADYLGVYITYTYTYLTAFFAVTSPSISLTALSVQRIEPQQYGDRDTAAPIAAVGDAPSWEPFQFADALTNVSFAAIAPRRTYTYLAGERA